MHGKERWLERRRYMLCKLAHTEHEERRIKRGEMGCVLCKKREKGKVP